MVYYEIVFGIMIFFHFHMNKSYRLFVHIIYEVIQKKA